MPIPVEGESVEKTLSIIELISSGGASRTSYYCYFVFNAYWSYLYLF